MTSNLGRRPSKALDDEKTGNDKPPHSAAKMPRFVIESESGCSTDHGPIFNSTAQNLMKKMGFKEGKGLGRHEQGITQPIEASKQKGRRGLGSSVRRGLDGPPDVGWDFEAEEEQLKINEQLDWFENEEEFEDEFDGWMTEGPVKLRIDDETTFCDESILHDVLSSKSIFDEVEGEEMRQARTRSNPYEAIRSVFFLNRAAMKMANMDSVFDFMFTSPRKIIDDPKSDLVEGDELFSFADVCAGPGGFSEYVLWKKRGMCRGFGFTLRGENDFKLCDFNAGPPEMFQAHYGVKDDGDVFDEANQLEFQKFVMRNTKGRGVHLMMADGGFSVDGQENIQEILSHRLYLCQFLVALLVLRKGGNFVCKLFDLFTPFSVGLVYLMSLCFERIAIFKPVTSRPANSERYIVCQGRKQDCDGVERYFRKVNRRMSEIHPGRQNSDRAVSEVVPLEVLTGHEAFYEYMRGSNDRMGRLQCMSLLKIKTFVQNKILHDEKQTNIKRDCLLRWCIPDLQKKNFITNESQSSRFNRLVKAANLHLEQPLANEKTLDEVAKVKRDFRVLPISSKDRYFLLSSGKGSVHRSLINKQKGSWEDCGNIRLPRDTLLDVECVEEQRGEEGKARKRFQTYHVNDVLVWSGEDLRSMSFDERLRLVSLLVEGATSESRPDLLKLHVKATHRLTDVEEEIFGRIEMGIAKGKNYVKSRLLPISGHEKHYIVPIGICMVKVINSPWMTAWSRSQQREYFYHTCKRESVFEVPKEAVANYAECWKNSLLWCWDETNRQESLLEKLNGVP